MVDVQGALAQVQTRVQAVRAQIPRGPVRDALSRALPSGVGKQSTGFAPDTNGIGAELAAGIQSIIGPYRGAFVSRGSRTATYRGQSVNIGGYREAAPVAINRLGPYRLTS